MTSQAELRWFELVRKPHKTKEEIEEKERVGVEYQEELNFDVRFLLTELKNVGINIISLWDLVNTSASYPEAIDPLIKHLPLPYHKKNKEAIIRALTVKEAKGKANKFLLDEYTKIPKEENNLRWVAAHAFTVLITKEDVGFILQLVKDKSNGPSRTGFIYALRKIKSTEVENCLIDSLNDPDLVLSAIITLGKIKSKKAKNRLTALVDDKNNDVKKEAIYALKKIG